jgi:NDP-sugar pyrophosphorylase family protein
VKEHPLGTAGGTKYAEEYLDEGPFVATTWDVLAGINLTGVIEAHLGSAALATVRDGC